MDDIQGLWAAIGGVAGAVGGTASSLLKSFLSAKKDAEKLEERLKELLREEKRTRRELEVRIGALEAQTEQLQANTLSFGSRQDMFSIHGFEVMEEKMRDLETLEPRIAKLESDGRELETRFHEFVQGEIVQWRALQRELGSITAILETLKLQVPRRR